MALGVGQVHLLVRSSHEQSLIGRAHLGDGAHVPDVVLIRVDLSLCGKDVKRSQLEVAERFHGPAIASVSIDKAMDHLQPVARRLQQLLDVLSSPGRIAQGGDGVLKTDDWTRAGFLCRR